jgi:hypothetical protein
VPSVLTGQIDKPIFGKYLGTINGALLTSHGQEYGRAGLHILACSRKDNQGPVLDLRQRGTRRNTQNSRVHDAQTRFVSALANNRLPIDFKVRNGQLGGIIIPRGARGIKRGQTRPEADVVTNIRTEPIQDKIHERARPAMVCKFRSLERARGAEVNLLESPHDVRTKR